MTCIDWRSESCPSFHALNCACHSRFRSRPTVGRRLAVFAKDICKLRWQCHCESQGFACQDTVSGWWALGDATMDPSVDTTPSVRATATTGHPRLIATACCFAQSQGRVQGARMTALWSIVLWKACLVREGRGRQQTLRPSSGCVERTRQGLPAPCCHSRSLLTMGSMPMDGSCRRGTRTRLSP